MDVGCHIFRDAVTEISSKDKQMAENFMLEVLLLYLIIPGRINFLQLIDMLDYYRTHFQIEFCYRDSKQFTGLTVKVEIWINCLSILTIHRPT